MTRVSLLFVLVLAFGCDSPTGVKERRVAGIIAGVHPDDPHIVVPDTVQAGESFTVSVRTYGSNGCVRKGGTEVDLEERTAAIAPYNIRRVGEDVVCPDVVSIIEHTATLHFEEAGPALVQVLGRSLPQGDMLLVQRGFWSWSSRSSTSRPRTRSSTSGGTSAINQRRGSVIQQEAV